MSAGVLFDEPGPRTRARHLVYNVVAVLAVLAVLGFVVYRLNETGQLEYAKWEPFVTPDIVRAIGEGLLTTLKMAAVAIVAAVVLGMALGIGKLSEHRWLRWPCWLFVEFFRAVPLVLLIIFVFFGVLGSVEDFNSKAFWAVVIALTLYNGSVLAEVFRAGIQAVPRGQGEAAYAVGMRKHQVMRQVLLPQGVKLMIPSIISQCVVALKDTSLSYVVAGVGLTRVGKSIYTEFANHVPTLIVISVIYICVNLLLTALATWVQRRFVGEKKILAVGAVAGVDVTPGAAAPLTPGR